MKKMRERAKNRTAKLPRQCTPKVEPLIPEPGLTSKINNPALAKTLSPSFGKINDGSVFPGARSVNIGRPLVKLYQNVVDNFNKIRDGMQVLEMALGKDPRLDNARSIVELIFDEWRDENEVT
jgi:hypothetical protein